MTTNSFERRGDVMESFTRGMLLLIGGIVGGIVLAIWVAGAVSKETVLHGLLGILVLAPFIFLVATALKMPFVGFTKSLFAYGLIMLVAIVSIAALDVVEGIKEAGSLSELTGMSPYFLLGSTTIVLLTLCTS